MRIAAGEVFMAVSIAADGSALAEATAAFEDALLASEGAPGPDSLLRAAVQAGNGALASSQADGVRATPAWLVALVAEGHVVLGRSGHWNAGLQRGSDLVPVFGQAGAGPRSGAGLEEIHRISMVENDSVILAPGELFQLDRTSLMVTCRARAPQAAANGLVELLHRSGAHGDIAVQVLRFQDEAAASLAFPRPQSAPAISGASREPVPSGVPGWAWVLTLGCLVLGLSLVAGGLFWLRRDETRLARQRASLQEATSAATSVAPSPRASAPPRPTTTPRHRPRIADARGATQPKWRSVPLRPAPSKDPSPYSPPPLEPSRERVTTVHVLVQDLDGADANALSEALGKAFPGQSVAVVGVLADQTGDVATGVVYWRPAGRGLAEAVAKTLGYEARQFPPSLDGKVTDAAVLLVPAGRR